MAREKRLEIGAARGVVRPAVQIGLQTLDLVAARATRLEGGRARSWLGLRFGRLRRGEPSRQ
ncbi:MAG: hypothetical protein ACK4NA_13835 [Alphaproteobacteria bacterium]